MPRISRKDLFNYASTDTKPTDNIPAHSILIESDTGNAYEFDGNTWRPTGTAGAAHVTTQGVPKAAVTPTIKTNGGGTTSTGSSVTINSGAAAGSQHLQAAADVEADVLQELVHFEFVAGDEVIRVHIGLSVLPAASEVQDLKFVINGDIVADATALFNETGISWVLRNEVLEVGQGSAVITSVGCIATASGVASSVATGARIYCMGYKEA